MAEIEISHLLNSVTVNVLSEIYSLWGIAPATSPPLAISFCSRSSKPFNGIPRLMGVGAFHNGIPRLCVLMVVLVMFVMLTLWWILRMLLYILLMQ